MTLKTFTAIMTILGSVPALGFPILYHVKSRWWKNTGGRIVMSLAVCFGLIYSLALIAAIFGRERVATSGLYLGFRVFVTVFITCAVWYQFVMYIRIMLGKEKANGIPKE